MVNGEPLSRVPIPSSCHPAVKVLPNGRRKGTRSACKSWKRLNASACLTSKLDGPLSARASSGLSGAVRSEMLAQWPQEGHAVGMQVLEEAERQRMLDVEVGWSLVRAGVERVFRRGLRHRAGRVGEESADDRARIVNRFRKRVAGLKAESRCGEVLLHGYLQGVIGGM